MFIKDNPDAESFYNELGKYLARQGVDVSYDPGEPYTSPEPADIWIGHSRGVDRLRFAPDDTQTIGLSAPHYEGAILHPKDEPEVGKEPTKFHFMLTDEMKKAIDEAVERSK